MLPLRLALVQQQRLRLNIVDTAKRFGTADGPVHRRGGNPERALEIVQQLQRIARGTIHLVDERENRQPVTAADFEQLPRLVLDAMGGVDDHHDTVGGNERPVGVFGEVFVAGRVEQRHAPPVDLEFERGGRDRDAALLLERHPVRRCVTPIFPASR